MKNPLMFYKERQNISFRKLATELGFNKLSVASIASASPQGLLQKKVGTLLDIKRTIGVDLIKFIEENYVKHPTKRR